MTLLLICTFWSCQSTTEPVKVVTPPPVERGVEPGVAIGFYGNINAKNIQDAVDRMNQNRRHKVSYSSGADYTISVEAAGGSWFLELRYRGQRIQRAKSVSQYEIPLVAAALARDHIADVPASASVPQTF